MRIILELESTDIEHFREAFLRARRVAECADEIDILDAAKTMLDQLCVSSVPAYVRKRLVHVQHLIVLLEDDDFGLPAPERLEALAALTYFGDPEDLVPDHLEGIGLIDDAILLELLARRMRRVLDAYRRFCAFRTTLETGKGGLRERTERASALADMRRSLLAELGDRRSRGTRAVPAQ